jgi:spore germination protein KA
MFRHIFKRNKPASGKAAQAVQREKFTQDLDENIKYIQEALVNCCDLESRSIRIGRGRQIRAHIFFLDGMVDSAFMAANVLKPLMLLDPGDTSGSKLDEEIFNSLLPAGTVDIIKNPNMLVSRILSGSVAIIIKGRENAFAVEVIGW